MVAATVRVEGDILNDIVVEGRPDGYEFSVTPTGEDSAYGFADTDPLTYYQVEANIPTGKFNFDNQREMLLVVRHLASDELYGENYYIDYDAVNYRYFQKSVMPLKHVEKTEVVVVQKNYNFA